MPNCSGECNVSSLLADFCLDEKVCDVGLARITEYISRLCSYAKQAGKLLCEMRMTEMEGFVGYLYGLEDPDGPADQSRQEIYIVTLFYDFLAGRGCVAGNPLRELKEAAVRQLMKRLGGSDK